MSSGLENEQAREEELSFLARENIEHEEVTAKGKLIIWDSSRIAGVHYFICREQFMVNGVRKDCKGKGYSKNGQQFFYLTKGHGHNADATEFEKKHRLKQGLITAEASPTVKTKSLRRSMKRGAGVDLLTALPKDESIDRQIRRKKYKTNISSVDTGKLANMVIPEVAKLTHDGLRFLKYDSRLLEPEKPWIIVWISEFSHSLLKRTKVIGFDATYKKTPRGFYKLFTLHCVIDEKFLVVGFAWMRSKTEDSFRRVFKQFFYLSAEKYPLLEAFVSDYEAAPSKVLKSMFPAIEAIRCILHLSQYIQKGAKKRKLARFYVNQDLKSWIILFSKLAYLQINDVLFGYRALVDEYYGMVLNQIASDLDNPKVESFFKYVQETYMYRGPFNNSRAAYFKLELWNVNRHVILQRPVTNNAVEAFNKEYNSHFAGGGKSDRSKVIRHQMDEEESVRHMIIRHEQHPEEEFREVRARQLESEERIYGIVADWNAARAQQQGEPADEKLLDFLRSIQDAMCYAKGQNPDEDEFEDDDQEDEENVLYLMDDINVMEIV